ncbi:hypothetical protein E4U52_006498, partial [Claviceps spartinae]
SAEAMLDAEATRGSNARQNAVFEPQCHVSNTIMTENLNKSVEKPVQKALRTPSPGAASWASITARSVSGRSWFFGAAQPPLPLNSSPPRVYREVLDITRRVRRRWGTQRPSLQSGDNNGRRKGATGS